MVPDSGGIRYLIVGPLTTLVTVSSLSESEGIDWAIDKELMLSTCRSVVAVFQTGSIFFTKAHALASSVAAAGNDGSTSKSYPASYDKHQCRSSRSKQEESPFAEE
jgi:hypothetical protein